jgi:hypothetical protein
MENIFCVYAHKKPNGVIFYIGIGNKERPYYKFRKNKHWMSIIKKYPDYIVEILHENLDWKTACEFEVKLISEYKRKTDGGTLCNITLGGDGAYGLKHTNETKEKLKILSTGNKNCIGFKHTEQTRKNMSLAHLGKIPSEETRLKMSIKSKGRKNPKAKICVLKAHEKNRGRVHSEEEKLRRKTALIKALGKPIEVYGIRYETIEQYCSESGINRSTLNGRLRSKKNTNYIKL